MTTTTMHRIKRSNVWLGLLSVGFLLASCQSRTATEVRYYILQNVSQSAAGDTVIVERVELPVYLRSSNLVLEVSAAEIRPAQYHIWREPLENGIRRVLAAELSARLAEVPTAAKELSLDLAIEKFHGTEAGRVTLQGTWLARVDGASKRSFSIETSLLGDGYAELANAHLAALVVLADEIAAAMSVQ